MSKKVTLSRRKVEAFVKCPRCFWLEVRHEIKQPESYPLALNVAMDMLLKAEFDEYRARTKPHPILMEYRIPAKLFGDLPKLQEWRNNRKGLRWTDPATGHTLFGAVDDVLEFPDRTLAVLDYKSSGANEITIYPSYQLQLDVYTFLLQKMGYKTRPKAYLAFFMAVKDGGFNGHLPFRGEVKEVETEPERVYELFQQAAEAAQSDRMPSSGEECDLCRWFDEANSILIKE